MYRYTTPTLTITISDVDFYDVQTFRISIEQGRTEILKVVDADDSSVDSTNKTISVTLTQDETASLREGKAEVQARVVFKSGEIQATKKAKVSVYGVLDEVII